MANNIKKSEHSGAKNGGGAWETRENAKKMSNRVRREADKVLPVGEHFDEGHECHWFTCEYGDDRGED